jgi:hypothetical protein
VAIFLNTDESRICLVRSDSGYELVCKALAKGTTREEEAYLRRTPKVVSAPWNGFVAKVDQRQVTFLKPLKLVDFNKFGPHEPTVIDCPAGEYTLDCITAIVDSRTANLVVLENTTIGLAEQGLEAVMRRQTWEKQCEAKRQRVREVVAEHFGLPVDQLDDDFCLTYINGLGTKIGTGPYRSLAVFPNQKPALIRAGISVREIADQLI